MPNAPVYHSTGMKLRAMDAQYVSDDDDFKGIDRIVPLVENPTAIFAATKRVEYYPIADYEVQSMGFL